MIPRMIEPIIQFEKYHFSVIVIVLLCISVPMVSEDISRIGKTLHVNVGAFLQCFPEDDKKIVRKSTRK